MDKKRAICFVTGNANKFKEFSALVEGVFEPVRADVDQTGQESIVSGHFGQKVPELQGTPIEISIAKARHAYKELKKPLIVEDTSLGFDALNGMPGPYINSKYFLQNLGTEGLPKLLKGFNDDSATALCVFTYIESETAEPVVFKGETKGKIVQARGPGHFGWDPIFQPEGFDKTYPTIPF